MNHDDLKAAELRRKRGTKVFLHMLGGIVRYHDTDVVAFTDSTIRLCTGGWESPATKRRMNQASEALELGFRVYQEDYTWYAEYRGKTYRFHEGLLTLDRRGL